MQVVKTITGLFKTGFFHIVGAGSLNKILMALLSIILVRVLTKEDYGAYAYAFNIVNFFVVFNGLGVVSAILQICSESYNDKKSSDSFFSYGYKSGLVVDCLMAGAILLVAYCAPLAIRGSNTLLALYCVYPLFVLLYEIKLTYLRVNLKNREYAFATNIQTVLLVSLSVFGACIFQATGLIVGQEIAFLAAYIYLYIKYPSCRTERKSLSRSEKGDFWSIASISAFNNGVSQALTLVGTFLVGLLLTSNQLVASYQAATLVPFGLLFIPSAVMTYCYPYFARNKNDRRWTLVSYVKVIAGSSACMIVVTVLVIAFADYIVSFLFGEQYLDIVPTLRILMIGFFATASLRMPTGNLLVTQRRLLFNALNGVLSIAVCIVSSLCFIPAYGLMGAAIAYDITMLFGAMLNVPYYVLTVLKIPEDKQMKYQDS